MFFRVIEFNAEIPLHPELDEPCYKPYDIKLRMRRDPSTRTSFFGNGFDLPVAPKFCSSVFEHGASLVHEQPVVLPQVSHFMHVPLRTKVKLAHSGHASPT